MSQQLFAKKKKGESPTPSGLSLPQPGEKGAEAAGKEAGGASMEVRVQGHGYSFSVFVRVGATVGDLAKEVARRMRTVERKVHLSYDRRRIGPNLPGLPAYVPLAKTNQPVFVYLGVSDKEAKAVFATFPMPKEEMRCGVDLKDGRLSVAAPEWVVGEDGAFEVAEPPHSINTVFDAGWVGERTLEDPSTAKADKPPCPVSRLRLGPKATLAFRSPAASRAAKLPRSPGLVQLSDKEMDALREAREKEATAQHGSSSNSNGPPSTPANRIAKDPAIPPPPLPELALWKEVKEWRRQMKEAKLRRQQHLRKTFLRRLAKATAAKLPTATTNKATSSNTTAHSTTTATKKLKGKPAKPRPTAEARKEEERLVTLLEEAASWNAAHPAEPPAEPEPKPSRSYRLAALRRAKDSTARPNSQPTEPRTATKTTTISNQDKAIKDTEATKNITKGTSGSLPSARLSSPEAATAQPSGGDDGLLRLSVCGLLEKPFAVVVPADGTVGKLCAAIGERLGLSRPADLRLSLGSQPLGPDSLLLADAGLRDGHYVEALPRIRGGADDDAQAPAFVFAEDFHPERHVLLSGLPADVTEREVVEFLKGPDGQGNPQLARDSLTEDNVVLVRPTARPTYAEAYVLLESEEEAEALAGSYSAGLKGRTGLSAATATSPAASTWTPAHWELKGRAVDFHRLSDSASPAIRDVHGKSRDDALASWTRLEKKARYLGLYLSPLDARVLAPESVIFNQAKKTKKDWISAVVGEERLYASTEPYKKKPSPNIQVDALKALIALVAKKLKELKEDLEQQHGLDVDAGSDDEDASAPAQPQPTEDHDPQPADFGLEVVDAFGVAELKEDGQTPRLKARTVVDGRVAPSKHMAEAALKRMETLAPLTETARAIGAEMAAVDLLYADLVARTRPARKARRGEPNPPKAPDYLVTAAALSAAPVTDEAKAAVAEQRAVLADVTSLIGFYGWCQWAFFSALQKPSTTFTLLESVRKAANEVKAGKAAGRVAVAAPSTAQDSAQPTTDAATADELDDSLLTPSETAAADPTLDVRLQWTSEDKDSALRAALLAHFHSYFPNVNVSNPDAWEDVKTSEELLNALPDGDAEAKAALDLSVDTLRSMTQRFFRAAKTSSMTEEWMAFRRHWTPATPAPELGMSFHQELFKLRRFTPAEFLYSVGCETLTYCQSCQRSGKKGAEKKLVNEASLKLKLVTETELGAALAGQTGPRAQSLVPDHAEDGIAARCECQGDRDSVGARPSSLLFTRSEVVEIRDGLLIDIIKRESDQDLPLSLPLTLAPSAALPHLAHKDDFHKDYLYRLSSVVLETAEDPRVASHAVVRLAWGKDGEAAASALRPGGPVKLEEEALDDLLTDPNASFLHGGEARMPPPPLLYHRHFPSEVLGRGAGGEILRRPLVDRRRSAKPLHVVHAFYRVSDTAVALPLVPEDVAARPDPIRLLGKGAFGIVELVSEAGAQVARKVNPLYDDKHQEKPPPVTWAAAHLELRALLMVAGAVEEGAEGLERVCQAKAARLAVEREKQVAYEPEVAPLRLTLVFPLADSSLSTMLESDESREGVHARLIKRIILDIAAGLDFLHQSANLLHLDVKPHNVLYQKTRWEERFLVTDLGLARPLSLVSRKALLMGGCGTEHYQSPELYERRLVSIGPPTDVFQFSQTILHVLNKQPAEPPLMERLCKAKELRMRMLMQQMQYRREGASQERQAELAQLNQELKEKAAEAEALAKSERVQLQLNFLRELELGLRPERLVTADLGVPEEFVELLRRGLSLRPETRPALKDFADCANKLWLDGAEAEGEERGRRGLAATQSQGSAKRPRTEAAEN